MLLHNSINYYNNYIIYINNIAAVAFQVDCLPQIELAFAYGCEHNMRSSTLGSMGGKWGVGKKEMCHRPHGVLITITKHGEQKKLVIGHEKPPTTPT